jgi:hypothetical protein
MAPGVGGRFAVQGQSLLAGDADAGEDEVEVGVDISAHARRVDAVCRGRG